MADEKYSDERIEANLHEIMRQIADMTAETPLGHETLRIALSGPYAALLRMEKAKNGTEAPIDIKAPDGS